MGACCNDSSCGSSPAGRVGDAFWKALVWAFVLNLAMFGIEIVGAIQSESVALLADAMDFLGDAVNYGASLAVLGMASVWRSRLALGKGLVMAGWGVLVLAKTLWSANQGVVPIAETMTAISILALVTNLSVAWMLYRHRAGDANRASVWLCARNDAVSNVAVLVAAQLVLVTGKGWPDLVAACGMAVLGLGSGITVVRQARRELRAGGDQNAARSS